MLWASFGWIIWGHVWQGEERDSSDEEWEAAYNALDAIAQIGWGNRRVAQSSVAAHLVRDVYVAADEMHDQAMSEMEGNTLVEEESPGVGAGAEEDTSSPCTEWSVHPVDSMEQEMEGEFAFPGCVRWSDGFCCPIGQHCVVGDIKHDVYYQKYNNVIKKKLKIVHKDIFNLCIESASYQPGSEVLPAVHETG